MSDATKPRLTIVSGRAPQAAQAAPSPAASLPPALEFALDLSRIGYWEYEIETDRGIFSDTWLEIAGWSREAWAADPDPWTARCHPDDRERAREELNAHLSGKAVTFEIEYRQQTEQGDYRWMLNRGGVSERDAAGRPRRIVGTTIDIDARKRSENALRESELRYRTVAEFAGGFVQEYVFDAQGRPVFTWATEGVEQVLGITVEEIKRNGWQSMIVPEDRSAGYERLTRQLRGEPTSGVMRIVNARGEHRWLHMMARPFLDESGRVSRVVGVIRDITESRQMQDALRHSEFRYRTVAALTPGYAHEFRVHPDGRAELVWASEGFRDVYGCDYQEWNRRGGWEAFCHPDDLAASADREARWHSGEQTAGVARIVNLKGETRWLRCINRPLVDPASGRITATVGIGHDITDIMEAQEAARVSEERFRIAVDAMAGLIYETDLSTGVDMRWPGLERLLGFGPGEIPETLSAWDDLIHPEDRLPVPSHDIELPMNSDGVIEVEYRVRNKAGGYEHVLDRSVLLHDVNGRPCRRIGCMTNVSERKRLERALLDIANREQQRIGNDLHDGIGQELTGVALLLRSLTHQLAKDCPQAVPTAEQTIALVNRTIENARMLARGLSPANLERGGLDFALRELALQMCRASSVAIRFTSRGIAHLRLDEIAANHLYRIAQEAISNALRHANPTHIEVSLNVTQRRVRLTVADDGVGLDHHPDAGAGLGLKIMQYRARMVGGELLVESGEPHGLTITCTCVQPAP